MAVHIGIEAARSRLGDLIAAAQRGEKIHLTRRGRPVATLTPLNPPPAEAAPGHAGRNP